MNPKSAELFCRSLIALLCFSSISVTALAAGTPQIPEADRAERALPIELDAAYSELDRRNNRLVFRNLHITQGSLAISADEATADPADFENSTWIFTGNVEIRNAGLTAWCDKAEMSFSNNTFSGPSCVASRHASRSRAPAAARPKAAVTCSNTTSAREPSR